MEVTKINLKKIKAAETKKRIFESAIELIKKQGLNNVSVDSIVENAGISKGSFYVHYESKFALIAEYVNTVDLNYEEYFTSLPPDKNQSDLLIMVTKKIIDVLINNIGFDLMRLTYEALLKRNTDAAKVISYNRKLYQIYRQIIKQGVQRGEFREEINIDSVSNHCIMSIRGMTYEWCIRYPDFDLKKEVLEHFAILLTGIKNNRPVD